MANPSQAGASGSAYTPPFTPRTGGGQFPSNPKVKTLAGTEQPTEPPKSDPGALGVNVSTPQGAVTSIGESAFALDQMITGVGDALFGRDKGLVGGIPVIGDIGRFIGDNPISSTLYKIPGAAAEVISTGLEHVTIGEPQWLKAEYANLPPEAKAAAEASITQDPGASGHYMYQAVRDYRMAQQEINPELNPTLDLQAGSLADVLTRIFDFPLQGSTAAGRLIATIPKVSSGMTRLQEIAAIAAGGVSTGVLGTGIAKGSEGLTDVEARALEMFATGKWTEDQANDYIATAGEAFSHDPAMNVAGSLAFDPTLAPSLGAAALERFGVAGLRLSELAAGVERVAAAGGEVSDLAKGQLLLRQPGSSGVLNWMGKLAEREDISRIAQSYGENVYSKLQGTTVGRVAKVTRTIIDPLHALGPSDKTARLLDLASNETAVAATAQYGMRNTSKVIELLHADGLADSFANNFATYAGNVLRQIVADQFRAAAIAKGVAGNIARVKTIPGDVVDTLMTNVPRSYLDMVKRQTAGVRKLLWDDAARLNLGERMAAVYGVRDPQGWVAWFAEHNLNGDQLGYLHAGSYGKATESFLNAVGESAHLYSGSVPLERMILLNVDTLTEQGARGMLNKLAAKIKPARLKQMGFKTVVEYQASIIRKYQTQYPDLRYVALNETNLASSVDNFITYAQELADSHTLPTQLVDAEIKGLPPALKEFHASIRDAWTLGFRPEDAYLWGLKIDSEGRWIADTHSWVDHVANAVPAYRPIGVQALNIAGQAIPVPGRAARVLDTIEAGARTLTSKVASATITENARNRFVSIAQVGKRSRISALNISAGLTEAEAAAIFKAVQDAAQTARTTARGLVESDMWKATAELVPERLRDTFTSRDLRNLILEAYDGELRFVGLTQKLTGRAKVMLAPIGGNIAGYISESLWGVIKFRINAMFQLQERIEPIVLNAGRGVEFLWGSKMSQNDIIASRLFKRMADTGIARISDIDMVEYSAMAMVGAAAESAVRSKIGPSALQQIVDVKGAKRVNMLRTWQHGLGEAVKPSFDHMPGLWQNLVDNYVARAGYALTDDEIALRYLSEQMLGNDFPVVEGALKRGTPAMNFDNVVSEAEWHRPIDLGELRPLNLDFMAERLAMPVSGGKVITTISEMRAALSDRSSGLTIGRIKDALARNGASPDYIRRVENALNFHVVPFWRNVRTAYNLTEAQVTQLQRMIELTAERRGMTPVDYLSQVYAPMVQSGEKAAIRGLSGAVSILKAPEEGASFEALADQLAAVFVNHLDPSMQRTLVEAFTAELDGEITRLAASADPADQARAIELMKVKAYRENPNPHSLLEARKAAADVAPPTGPDLSHLTHEERMMLDPAFDLDTAIAESEQKAWVVADAMSQTEVDNLIATASSTVAAKAKELASNIDDWLTRNKGGYRAGDLVPISYLEIDGIDEPVMDYVTRMYPDFIDGTHGDYIRMPDLKSIKETGLPDARDALESVVDERTAADPIIAMTQSRDVSAGGAELIKAAESVDLKDEHWLTSFKVADSISNEMRAEIDRATSMVGHPRSIRAGRETVTKKWSLDASGEASTAVYDTKAEAVAAARDQAVAKVMADNADEMHYYDDIEMIRAKLNSDVQDARVAQIRDEVARELDARNRATVGRNMADMAASETEKKFNDLRSRYGTVGPFEDQLPTWPEYTVAPRRPGTPSWTTDDVYSTADPAYVYHVTDDLDGIRSSGELTPNAPSYRGEQDVWPDGSSAPRSYWVSKPKDVTPFISGEGVDPAIVRVMRDDSFAAERGTGDIINPSAIPARRLEYYGVDGGWHPVDTSRFPDSVPAIEWLPSDTRAFMDEVSARASEIRSGVKRVKKNRNPEVERAVREFAAWSKDIIADGLLSGGGHALKREFRDKLWFMPTEGAAHYNSSEALMLQSVTNAMRLKEEDAFMLQYFRRNRTWLERSVNHPMFGIYPSSYMWGKIAPELIRFIAKEPFGIHTGAMAQAMSSAQASIALQREWDPEFDKLVKKAGESETLWFLGYLMPSVPWDVSAAFPSWMRDLAKQGLANQAKRDKGEPTSDIDLGGSIYRGLEAIDPRRSVKQIRGPLGEIGDWISSGTPQQEATPQEAPQESTTPANAPATELQPVMTNNLDELRKILAGQ